MAKLNFLPGILVMVFLSVMTLIGCTGRINSPLVGVWVNSDGMEKQFRRSGNWEMSVDGTPHKKGTYSLVSNRIVRVVTYIHGNIFDTLEPRWYNERELERFMHENNAFSLMVLLPFENLTEVHTYSVNDNIATFSTYFGGTARYEQFSRR